MLKKIISVLIVITFAVIAGFALLHKGLPPTHDGEYHVIRFFLFDEALRDGNLYPRWAGHLNNSFGVPLFNYVYPLPNYMASLFHLFGASFIDSFKINMFLAIIIGGIFFYLWSEEFWGKLGGIVSSIFYTFSPYHFVDIYIRGSVGEVWALAFFPGFLWAYTKFTRSKQNLYLVLSSIFLAIIIFSHNILALMFFIFALLYATLMVFGRKEKKQLIVATLVVVLFGLGLSAIFWLPAIYETRYVVGLQIFDISSHFPDLYQLLIPSWGSGFSGAGIQNELSYQIGLANLLVIFLIPIIIIFQAKRKDRRIIYPIFFLICFVVVLFLMLKISSPIWKLVPLMNYFQFPWRLLSLEILFAPFLVGGIVSLVKNRYFAAFIAFLLIFMSFTLGIGYAKPAYYMYRNDNYYTSKSNFIDGTNSSGNVFNTIYLNGIPEKVKDRFIFIKGSGTISLIRAKSDAYSFAVRTSENSEVQVNLAYFPGWNVYINGRKEKIKSFQNGRFTLLIPKGENKVEVVFENTPIRSISTIISAISLIFMIALLINRRFVTIKK